MSTYADTQLFIAGRWTAASDGSTLPVFDPSTEQEIGRVAKASLADLDAALKSAQQGFKIWRDMTPATRGQLLRKAAQLVRERAPVIAPLLVQEQGKPLAEAVGEIMNAATTLEWFADEALRVYGRIVPHRTDPSVRQMVLKEPVGPVAAFTPWNFPVNQIVRKLGAGLAAGCSMILKAPEETPASPAAFIKCFEDAGLPVGVINLVYGDPAQISNYLISSLIVRKVTFTGSTQVGKHLASLAGKHMKRATMELGGHAPVIVAEDADVALAVRTVGAFKFRNAGQVCIAPTRFLVHESLEEEFGDAFKKHALSIVVGNGLDANTQMGPLANPRRTVALENLMRDATEQGARLVTGGRLDGPGNFWAPTILANVPTSAALFNEEPFGPIAGIQTFSTLDSAIDEANRLPYGLAGYAFTRSLASTELLSRQLELGMLWINQQATPSAELPFGGVKDSGYGSEGGPEAIEAYLNTKSVSVTSS